MKDWLGEFAAVVYGDPDATVRESVFYAWMVVGGVAGWAVGIGACFALGLL